MILFDVCTRKFYEKNGEKKIKWYKAGVLKENDKGRRFLRLFHQPEVDYFIFEKEEPKSEEKESLTSKEQ